MGSARAPSFSRYGTQSLKLLSFAQAFPPVLRMTTEKDERNEAQLLYSLS